MPTLARHLPLTALQPGMVLARPLVTSHGGYLEDGLPAGHVLTAACLDKLRRGHSETACVAQEDPRTDEERESARRAQAARLAVIFRRADLNHRPTRLLHDALLAYRSDFAVDEPPPLPATATAAGAANPTAAPLRPVKPVTEREIAAQLERLPAFPTVVEDVLATLDDEDSHLRTLSDHLTHDPVLGAQVLALANRPHGQFGHQPVHDLYNAVTLVGLRRIRELVARVALVDFARAAGCSPSFWQHSLAVAIAAEELAAPLRLARQPSLVAGLLHDIGALWLRVCRSHDLEALRAWHQMHPGPREASEQAVFGMDHAAIGRRMAIAWRLPDDIIEAISEHHAPAPERVSPLVTAVHLAELIAIGLDLPPRSDNAIDHLSDTVPATLGAHWHEALPDLLGVIEARYRFEVGALEPEPCDEDAETAPDGPAP